MLRAKLFALQEEERLAKIASTRKMQVGTGSRSEKIRTYNYKDSRRARAARAARAARVTGTASLALRHWHRVPHARTAGRAHGTRAHRPTHARTHARTHTHTIQELPPRCLQVH